MNKKIGERLEMSVREKMNIENFAIDMRVSKSTVYGWFKGKEIKASNLARACEILNVSADYILFGRNIVIMMPNLPFSDMEVR